jgi:hypothetical protein
MAVLAALLGACGPKSKLDLDLRSVSITVPRLLTPAIELVPQAPLPVDLPPLPPVESLLPAPVTPPAAPACRTAGPFDAPALTAVQEIAGPPAPDTFTQATLGAFRSGAKTGSLVGTITTSIQKLPTSTNSTGQRVDAWIVQHADLAKGALAVEAYQFVHPNPSPLATASGVYLVGLAWKDSVRGSLVFQPVGNGLFIVPNPVALASNPAQYVGVATDPATLTTVALTRNVTGRARVDLCGELVDTFTVTMTGTLTSPGVQRQIAWTQQIATGYGAANVDQTLSLTSPVDGFNWTRTERNTKAPKELS